MRRQCKKIISTCIILIWALSLSACNVKSGSVKWKTPIGDVVLNLQGGQCIPGSPSQNEIRRQFYENFTD